MKEKEIRKKAEAQLEGDFVVWSLQKVVYFQTDIFGVFDLIAIHRHFYTVQLIQLTTSSNASKRRKKITEWLRSCGLMGFNGAWLWHWNLEKGAFVKEHIFLLP